MTGKLYRPLVAVDVVVFGITEPDDDSRSLRMLLIERQEPPSKGQKALPGGLIRESESLDDAALRILRDKTGLALQPAYLEQLYTMGAPKRDPRERAIAVAYMALVKRSPDTDDPKNPYRPEWCPIDDILKGPKYKIAFDHREIIEKGHQRLATKARYAPLGFDLLPERFTFARLHQLYEAILGREIDKRNFYKKILSLGVLEFTGNVEPANGKGRPARIYRFDRAAYNALTKKGINFEI